MDGRPLAELPLHLVGQGLWPNAIRFALEDMTIPAGESFAVTLYHQAGASAAGEIGLVIFLDLDFNPYNGNEIEVSEETLARTGTAAVLLNVVSATVNAAEVPPGSYAVCARLHDGGRTRCLYASPALIITPSLEPPSIDAASLARSAGVMNFNVHGFPGQEVTVMASSDLINWVSLQTLTLKGTIWEFVDTDAGNFARRFYRAVLIPEATRNGTAVMMDISANSPKA